MASKQHVDDQEYLVTIDQVDVELNKKRVLKSIDLQVRRGEFVSVLGVSGCGKTTLLNTIAGFYRPSAGRLNVLQENKPTIGYVFQKDALFPWFTAFQNIASGELIKTKQKSEREKIISELAVELGVQEALNKYPSELSGGMAQRVEIARCLANEPSIILFDEPFLGLDVQNRYHLHDMLYKLWYRHSLTIILVTHDVDEALLLSDRLVILTGQPATIEYVKEVEISRPRDHRIHSHPQYIELRQEVFEILETEFKERRLVE
ncbi:MAG: ABC transporter ATP-binding protein [Candidatus Thiodiazotropha sp.]